MTFVIRKYKNVKFVVVLDDKGKRIAWKKHSLKKDPKKRFTVGDAKRIWKENNTLDKNLKTEKLKNVREVIDYRKGARPKRSTVSYQYVVEGRVGKRTITARSMQRPVSFPKDELRSEAWENFYYRLAESFDLPYDEAEGRNKANELGDRLKVKEGIVYYEAISN